MTDYDWSDPIERDRIESRIKELEAENARLRELIREVVVSGVVFRAQGYWEVQISERWFIEARKVVSDE